MSWRNGLTAFLTVVAAAAGACRSGSAQRAPGCELVASGHGPRGETSIAAVTVASGLEVPWSLAMLPGGDMLVTERPGRIRLVSGGALVPEPVATVPVRSRAESGLMGLAVGPTFSSDRFFYIKIVAGR